MQTSKSKRLLGGALGVLLMAGCQSAPEPVEVPAGASGPEPEAPPEPAVDYQPYDWQGRIDTLLNRGDRALSAGRLLEPSRDNAYDYYQQVLLIEPDNAMARTGIQAIMLSYLDSARTAAANSDHRGARRALAQAASIDPESDLVAEVRATIEAQAEARVRAQGGAEGSFHRLDSGALSARSDAVAAQLVELAEQVREQGASILISARNDAEGRWIYQQMRAAVPGFLLRGDIAIQSPPGVRVLPPI
ncbi:hypothetical protein [Marinimicrobium alkaliphilum]|uniref:hypothetical protein n=1 Tax=Marinimicrobium alkaliphilum TaxID=2202654 RepID=UPI000DB8F98D|nr:hypothetical protein [Marinimicrobium alkaliphilum]